MDISKSYLSGIVTIRSHTIYDYLACRLASATTSFIMTS